MKQAGLIAFSGLLRGKKRSAFLYAVNGAPLLESLEGELFIRFTYADRWEGGRPPTDFVQDKVDELIAYQFEESTKSKAKTALQEAGWDSLRFGSCEKLSAQNSRAKPKSEWARKGKSSKSGLTPTQQIRRKAAGCTKCKTKGSNRSCRGKHVYAIEVKGSPRKSLYVGKTDHTVECRFKQHKIGREYYTCRCFCEGAKRQAKGAPYLRGESIALRYDLFEDWNPVDGDWAEEELADKLGAHWN